MSAGVSTPSENSVDPEELREKLYTQLKNTGVVNVLKTQLRSQLLGQLQHRYDVGFHKGNQKSQDSGTKALNCAIAEYLEVAGHRYSLSIFQPESGAPCDALSRDEMMTLLGIAVDSPARKLLNEAIESQRGKGGPCFLSAVFQVLKHFGGSSEQRGDAGKISSSTQTTRESGSAVALLSSQLQQVESAYSHRLDGGGFQQKQLEDRMERYKRECDERVAREVAAQVASLRRGEGCNSRMSDSSCWRKQLEEQREDLDRIHLARSRELHERENRVMEQLNQQRVEMERTAFQQRKKMANEEETLQWKKEEFKRSCQSRKDEIETLETELRERERKLRRRETELDESRDAIITRTRKEVNEEMALERKKLLDQKMALESIQERTERDSQERLRSSLEKAKRTEAKLEECQSIIRRHKLTEESLNRQLNQQKDALSRSTEILTRRQDKDFTSLHQQLECSFDSGAGSLGVPGLQRILQESDRHQREVRKLNSKIRTLSKHKQQLEGELERFDDEIQQLKEKSLEQAALLDEAISERLEALDHAEELRLTLGGTQRRCSELKRKLERSTLEIATLKASTQHVGTTYGVPLSSQSQNMYPGVHPDIQSHQNFKQNFSPAAANPLVSRKGPSTSSPASKGPTVSLLKASGLDGATASAEFSWQASQLEREEEVLKKKLKDFRRKVEIGRRTAERELNGIARRVERSRNRERSKREATHHSTESDLGTDSDEQEILSSVSDCEPPKPPKSKAPKHRKWQRGATLNRESPQPATHEHIQRYVEIETPSGGMPADLEGTPSPIMLDVSPALKHAKSGKQPDPSTPDTAPSSSKTDPIGVAELLGERSEENIQEQDDIPGGLHEILSEVPENGGTMLMGVPSVLSNASNLKSSTENEARSRSVTVPEEFERQVDTQGTGKLDSDGGSHPEPISDAAAGSVAKHEEQNESALCVNERNRDSEDSIEVRSEESNELGEYSKLNEHMQAPPQTPSLHDSQASPPPEGPQAGTGVEINVQANDRNEYGVEIQHDNEDRSDNRDQATEDIKNVQVELEQSDDDGLLVDAIEAPEEDRSIELDNDDGDDSSETSFSSLPPELDSVGELSTGFSDGQEGRLSWGGEF